MYLVVRRGAFEELETGCVLAGVAAVRCLRRFGEDPEWAEAIAAWKERPGKVTLRARGGQWAQVLQEEDLSYAGDLDAAAVLALPPRRRSERSETLTKLQAMASELEPLPEVAEVSASASMTYVVNPGVEMSTGKTMAQVAHAATMAAGTGRFEDWVDAGCPARVFKAGTRDVFEQVCARDGLAAKVEDAGLTEVPPGTITVLAIAPVTA
ncbi:MAG TPA: aminoacyl-tRNA hydrolase [Baekduia sp.]|nr:aminoacyl-tRNA hydrolase [Baekduia sp.]